MNGVILRNARKRAVEVSKQNSDAAIILGLGTMVATALVTISKQSVATKNAVPLTVDGRIGILGQFATWPAEATMVKEEWK